MRGNSIISPELKYKLYEQSVQCFENDIEFMQEQFQKYLNRKPLSLREDFGGTGALSCGWVKNNENARAYAIDLDSEPQDYGKKYHLTKLSDEQQSRMNFINGNVLDQYPFKVDIIAAFNFSYFIFKERSVLLNYFQSVYKGLEDDGAFFVDIFGGTEAYGPIVEETEYDDHSYFWDCEKYNPLTNECLYYIHFKTLDDNHKYEKVFVYDWRMWTPKELEEIMLEAGFSKVIKFWEGEGEDEDGDGEFFQSEEEENCESWVTYIIGVK